MRNMKHWQDPLNALVGAWLVLSPWAMGFEAQMAPTASSVVVGLALIAASLGAMFVPRAWEEWSQAVLGLWMIASPWLLGGGAVRQDAFVLIGFALLGLSYGQSSGTATANFLPACRYTGAALTADLA